MADACCGPQSAEADPEPANFWRVGELRRAAVAAVAVGLGWLLDQATPPQVPLFLIAGLLGTVVAASTFVPDAVRNLRHGRIGVGTLMTIAAIGAVALGQIAEAALLAILFSIAEGLER